MKIINEERNYRELNEKLELWMVKKIKKLDHDSIIKYKTMSSYCLKCRKKKVSKHKFISFKNYGGAMQ